MVKVERVTEGCTLGEGPHWDAATQNLYFVDILGKKILRYIPSTKKLTQASLAPQAPSFIIPVEGKKNEFVVTLDNELAILSWDGESDKVTILKKIATVEKTATAPKLTFNDGKCDASGRLWAGTHSFPDQGDFSKIEPVGTLFSLNKGQLKAQAQGIRVANGLAFNEKIQKMFYIDSMTRGVDQYDFDFNNGTISNKKVWFSLDKFNIPGIPDGMTIDTDGNLWVAVAGGKRVLKVDGSKPDTLLDTIELPAEQVTSVAWGGPKLDELYVTTGAWEREGKKFPPPENGATYRITETGAKGLPGVSFRLN